MRQEQRLTQEDVVLSFFVIAIALIVIGLIFEGVLSVTDNGTLKNKWTLILFCPIWLVVYVVTLNNMAKD